MVNRILTVFDVKYTKSTKKVNLISSLNAFCSHVYKGDDDINSYVQQLYSLETHNLGKRNEFISRTKMRMDLSCLTAAKNITIYLFVGRNFLD